MNPYKKPKEEDFHHLCRQHQMHFVHLETQDGQMFDGIIDDVDDQSVTLIMPWGDMEQDRFDDGYGGGYGQGYGPGYGGPGYGQGYGGPGRYPRRFRRFRRHRFPFRFLNRIFFPFFY
ncbi:hypothetical protein [Alkalibacillus salilacus]|uniref:Uncharacterized protein n=1 Tax=Alkalibacillus salilacus TaxID=284582 RepID=A0ABT9VB85_9BACI|nr:hypothetical protein [Alkalibacillus salilacus]MDQ0158226.1 hypothetical protein [Alkalibacillus salilacus]